MLWLVGAQSSFAFHIVGGEVTYECLGGNEYLISLNVYRDCNCTGCANYDDPAYLYVFTASGQQHTKRSVPLGEVTVIDPPDIICAETLPDICVQATTYSTVINLPPAVGGYTLAYQRYSRNSTIVNIFNPDETGSTYYTNIPPSGLAMCNNSAVFETFPPTIICANSPLLVNQGATDVDGDSLVYEFCSPVIGGNGDCPQPGSGDNGCPTGIETSPPPYTPVSWIPPYSGSNPLSGSPQIVIDPQTGIITGTPTQVGQYVVGICVSEYRNGELINVVRRDFQFNVTPCEVVQAAVQSDQIDAEGNFIITACDDYNVQFQNLSSGATLYSWDFGDLTTTTDFSDLPNPSYAYPDSGTYYVTLYATKSNGACGDTAYITLNLYPTVVAAFTYSANCVDTPVSFTNTSTTTLGDITSTYWDYGDGIAEFATNPSHLYAQGGTYSVSLTITTNYGCEVTATQTVTVPPLPQPPILTSQLCPGLPTTLSTPVGTPPVTNWQWNISNGQSSTAPAPTYNLPPGSYTITLTVVNSDGCTGTNVRNVTVYPPFEADAGADHAICVGDSVQLQGSAQYPWFVYQWTPNSQVIAANTRTPTVFPSVTTIYTASVADPNGCSDTDQATVTVHPLPNVAIAADTLVCYGTPSVLQSNTSSNVTAWQWSNDAGYISTQDDISVVLDSTAIFVLLATDSNGCQQSDTLQINVINPIVTAFGNDDIEICVGDSVVLVASGGDVYLWSPAATLNNPTLATPTASPSVTTIYTLTASNVCFSDTTSVTVVVNPLPMIDAGETQTINVGEITQLQASANTPNIVWTPANTLTNTQVLTPFANPLQTTTYTLSATSDKNCAAIDTVSVIVTNEFTVLIPNAFSPNADYTNDLYRIVQLRGIKTLKRFAVYNRWGEKIFETSNVAQGWDGTYKGVLQEIGTYVYIIEGITFLDTPYTTKGNLTLVR